MAVPAKVKFVNRDQAKFFPTLKKRVDAYFKENNVKKTANGLMYFKVVFYAGGLAASYLALLLGNFPLAVQYGLWIVMGLLMACIGLNLCHDAIHGSFSNKKWANNALGALFNIVGANDYMWDITHNKAHHMFTNIQDHDEDIEMPFMRLTESQTWKKHHRYQQIYAFFMYPLATLLWVLLKDYKKFFKGNIGSYDTSNHPKSQMWRMFFFKAVHYTMFIVLPFMFLSVAWYHILFGILLMHFFEGYLLAIIFKLAHEVDIADFPVPNDENVINQSWAAHQLYTTANFATDNYFLNFIAGGLNFQVEHHLFPTICHVHFPKLQKMVKETAEEFGLPYHNQKTFAKAVKNHYDLLKRMGASADAKKTSLAAA